MSPRDIPADQTARFLASVLRPRARVLEVGCGDGRVAARLARRGFSMRGIDTDAAAVKAAQARGVKASVADYLGYHDDPFDAVVFTRSLHHIHPIGKVLDRAARLLVPGGLLVAEEFAREAADRATALWFYAVAALLESARVIEESEELSSRNPDPLARWREDHRRERLNTGRQMREAVARKFSIVQIEETPYLYRHFCGRLPENPLGARLARMLFEQETRGVADGSLRATGLRLVARKPVRRRSSSTTPRARRSGTASRARKSPRSATRKRPRS